MNNKEMEKLGRKPSAIRQLFEYGKKRKQEIGEENVFDFSIGNPSAPSPSIVKEKLIELLNNESSLTLHSYSSSSGHTFVKEAIIDHLNKTYDTSLLSDYVYLTSGAAAGLSISFHALINQDDEVIVFSPFWPEYEVLVTKANGKIVACESNLNDFQPDLEKLKEKITANTKMVIINSPNNPTGVVYNENTIKNISQILKEKEKQYNKVIYLLSDEPYRELIYTNEKYPFVTNYYDNSIVVYSFSKSLSLPGERIGYLLLNNKMKNVDTIFYSILGAGRALGFVCATTIFQKLIPSILGYTSDLSVYKKNQEFLCNELRKIGYETTNPDGAFYLFVKALEDDANKFVEVAKKFELLLVPSDSFGIKGYVRISYCVSFDQIKNSISAFKKLYEYYRN